MKKSYHTTKGYYEFLAKYILEEILPNDFVNLKISDKPDLRLNGSIGIEVTQSSSLKDKYASDIFQEISKKSLDSIDSKKIKKLESFGYSPIIYKNKICGYSGEATWVTIDPIETAFKEKSNKLGTYETETTHLFIYAPSFNDYNESDIKEFMKYAIGNQKASKKKYSIVFIFQYTHLFVCDLIKNNLMVLDVDNDLAHQCCIKDKEKNINLLP